MQRIKSSGNVTTEHKLIQLFKIHGIKGWRRNYPVKGRPDFVLLGKKVAIFADGCFWHGHNCRNVRPQQNKQYWDYKRLRNIRRDKNITKYFEDRGWTVLRFWECDIRRRNVDLGILGG